MPRTEAPGSHPGRAMTALTVASLVVVACYSVAVGGSGLLWLAWVVLALCTAGVHLMRDR